MPRSDTRPTSPGLVPHPAYTQWAPDWQRLLDVYEGSGGFTETARPYLYAHPREWLDHSINEAAGDISKPAKWVINPRPTQASPKLIARRKLARYENVAATLIDQLKAALFRKDATRSFKDPEAVDDTHPLRQFWEDADGTGRSIEAVMQDAWVSAGVFGHMVFVADRAGDTNETPTKADAPAVLVRSYTPLDMPDWLTDDLGQLRAVRLLEAVPRESFDEAAGNVVAQVRDLTETGWELRTLDKGRGQQQKLSDVTERGDHGFGALPVVLLYARRRPLTPTIGRSILGDPMLYIDLYNLISEVRELLRNQTFAILNIPLGDQGDIEKEKGLVGQSAGTQNVLFSSLEAAYVSPEGTNVQVYHEHMDRLTRTIYRLAVVSWESDSKDAESGDSRKLKKEDLHQMLSGYASECEQVETALAKLVYRAHYGESWEAQWEADSPSISYPDDFDVAGILDELEAVTQALALDLGETATRELKKRTIPKLLPNLPEDTMQQIEDEINALPVLSEQEKQLELMGEQGGIDAALADQNNEAAAAQAAEAAKLKAKAAA